MTRGFLSTTEIESRFFFSAFPPAWRVIINEKNGRSLSLSLSPILLHFRFRSRDRDARCSDAYRAPACFFARFLSPYPNDLPLFTSAEGVVSFARGEKEGRSSSLCSLPFRSGWKNPDETSSSLRSFYPQAWRKHQTGSRADFILATYRPIFPLKFPWLLEDAVM